MFVFNQGVLLDNKERNSSNINEVEATTEILQSSLMLSIRAPDSSTIRRPDATSHA